MLARKLKVKYKNDTSEMIAEIARRLDVPVKEIQNEYHMYWQDMQMVFRHYIGFGFFFNEFGHFLMDVRKVDQVVKNIEKVINTSYRMIAYYNKLELQDPPIYCKIKRAYAVNVIHREISRLVFLKTSIDEYEIKVRKQYPKKYKPKVVYLHEYIKRLEEHYRIPFSKFPIQVSHPIQEIYVQKMQKEGLLPNPVVYKNSQVQ
jgi:hypothetical protein